jgi:NTP pyrophosphatase (non-canonical NTP hydrolase)
MTNQKLEYIRYELPPAELLTQLAEEATELAHAALKLRRTLSDTNPTPIGGNEALRKLREEISDVWLIIVALELDDNLEKYKAQMAQKLERWVRRIEEARE